MIACILGIVLASLIMAQQIPLILDDPTLKDAPIVLLVFAGLGVVSFALMFTRFKKIGCRAWLIAELMSLIAVIYLCIRILKQPNQSDAYKRFSIVLLILLGVSYIVSFGLLYAFSIFSKEK